MSFRKKIIVSQIISFLIFFAALFPLIEKTASILVKDSIIESTSDLKDLLQKAGTEQDLIQSLKRQEFYSFFRMMLINDKGVVIFDSHVRRLLGEEFEPYHLAGKPEIQQALKKGIGYSVAESDTFRGRFAYIAETFKLQGETYILRTAFPYQQIEDLTENFQIGILIFSFLVLLFFNALILLIFNRLSLPIREIIRAIRSRPLEADSELPEIKLTRTTSPSDDFQRLAQAFNSLSRHIQEKIDDLKGERNEKEAILESLHEGVVAVNEKMEVLYINSTACKMLKISRSEILGKPFISKGSKVNQELMQKTQDLLSSCQKEGSIVTDSHDFGEESRTFIDLIAAPKGQGTGAISVLQDKTQHYKVIAMGKDFVANASHELRTPITIIKGYAETLHDFSDLSKKQYQEITEKISRNCERMENLVRSLLMLTDIENIAEDRFSEIDLLAVITNCRHIVRSIYSDAEVVINVSEKKILISADSGLIELALINLLENAAKYSEPPARIRIDVKPNLEGDVKIIISDQGQGIPKEDLEYIFHRFYRVDKTHSRRLGGAGLGLSIVKTIISKHGGTIEVDSTLGEGTTFTISIPVSHDYSLDR